MSAIRYPRLAQMLYNMPLLLTREKADVIEAVFRDMCSGRVHTVHIHEDREEPAVVLTQRAIADGAVILSPGSGPAQRRPYGLTREGIALIPIHGAMMQRAGMYDSESGLTSYSKIGSDISAAMSDSDVRGILLDIDSPGGQVAGAFELASFIHDASKQKPIYAFADEQATSGAHLLASASTKFFGPKLSTVGSIGVLSLHVDQTKYDADKGFVYTHVIGGAHKADLSPHTKLSDDARQELQKRVDRMYDEFTGTVAAHRGVEVSAVRGTEARLLSPDEAVKLGLMDGVATMGEVLAQLTADVGSRQYSQGAAATAHSQTPQETVMENPQGTTAALTPEQVAAQMKEASDKASAAATLRIKNIISSEPAKTRPKLAQHLAFSSQMSEQDAIATLSEAAEERAAVGALAAHMAQPENATAPVGAGAGGDSKLSEDEKAAAFIMGAGKRPALAAVK